MLVVTLAFTFLTQVVAVASQTHEPRSSDRLTPTKTASDIVFAEICHLTLFFSEEITDGAQ